MVYSMTGFGRSSGENEDFSLTIEMKAVNHKYLDIQIKSPYYFNYIDEDIKKAIRTKLNRGRVDVFIKSTRKIGNSAKINIDYDLAKILNSSFNDLKDRLKLDDSVRLNHILRYDDVVNLEYDEPDEDKTKKFILDLVDKSCVELKGMRELEGQNLKETLVEQLNEMTKLVDKIEKRSPMLTEEYRKRLLEKLNAIFDEVDSLDRDRINMEIALFSEKSDITEEIIRLNSHIKQFSSTLNSQEVIGRKLDFIVQEMNREVNTISSKSNDKEITRDSIELKTIIEKIREQIQNIE